MEAQPNFNTYKIIALVGLLVMAFNEVNDFIRNEGLTNPRGTALLKLQIIIFVFNLILSFRNLDLTLITSIVLSFLHEIRKGKAMSEVPK
jgi:hypothetical protein